MSVGTVAKDRGQCDNVDLRAAERPEDGLRVVDARVRVDDELDGGEGEGARSSLGMSGRSGSGLVQPCAIDRDNDGSVRYTILRIYMFDGTPRAMCLSFETFSLRDSESL